MSDGVRVRIGDKGVWVVPDGDYHCLSFKTDERGGIVPGTMLAHPVEGHPFVVPQDGGTD